MGPAIARASIHESSVPRASMPVSSAAIGTQPDRYRVKRSRFASIGCTSVVLHFDSAHQYEAANNKPLGVFIRTFRRILEPSHNRYDFTDDGPAFRHEYLDTAGPDENLDRGFAIQNRRLAQIEAAATHDCSHFTAFKLL